MTAGRRNLFILLGLCLIFGCFSPADIFNPDFLADTGSGYAAPPAKTGAVAVTLLDNITAAAAVASSNWVITYENYDSDNNLQVQTRSFRLDQGDSIDIALDCNVTRLSFSSSIEGGSEAVQILFTNGDTEDVTFDGSTLYSNMASEVASGSVPADFRCGDHFYAQLFRRSVNSASVLAVRMERDNSGF